MKWADFLLSIAGDKGFRTPSFKLTQSNALRFPESRRHDKQAGVPKAFRQYQNRYS